MSNAPDPNDRFTTLPQNKKEELQQLYAEAKDRSSSQHPLSRVLLRFWESYLKFYAFEDTNQYHMMSDFYGRHAKLEIYGPQVLQSGEAVRSLIAYAFIYPKVDPDADDREACTYAFNSAQTAAKNYLDDVNNKEIRARGYLHYIALVGFKIRIYGLKLDRLDDPVPLWIDREDGEKDFSNRAVKNKKLFWDVLGPRSAEIPGYLLQLGQQLPVSVVDL